ncbi:hypothetical protein [Capnocytophaga canimorsus]|uniref:hypothetical protein n=1 Tax=Capnocytophaga canimorsus TaxID=28188 RepID=UPI0028E6AA63|nr:hypothetical protein [Capnocytophaga canimorsus]MDT9499152.1 hypothetical protein [Capnocytophaga canimorsus]
MMHLCNISEDFIREVRYLLLYDANSLSFNENFKGNKPVAGKHLLRVDLHPNAFSRGISIKTKDKSDYIDIKLQFSFFDLSFTNRNIWFDFHKKQKYVVILASNTEMISLGNHREPLTLSVNDNIVDNASGKDAFQITLTGQTILLPKQSKITEPFRVLFFAKPLK